MRPTPAARTTTPVLAVLLCACAQPSRGGAPPHTAPAAAATLAPARLGTLDAVQVLDDVYLGAQPSADDLAAFAELGGETVVTLRTAEERTGYDEPARAAELGLEYVTLPWNGAEQLTDDVFARARELLGTAERPLLLHCGSGNRVGALWIPWRVLDGGLDLEAAVAEARAIGLKTPEYEASARAYVLRELRE